MLTPLEFSTEMDAFARAVAQSADPASLMDRFRGRLQDDFTTSRPAAAAEAALWSISEILDAPWGPGSPKLERLTLLKLINEWLALEERTYEAVQVEFFQAWKAKADQLLVHPTIPTFTLSELARAWAQAPFDEDSLDEGQSTD